MFLAMLYRFQLEISQIFFWGLNEDLITAHVSSLSGLYGLNIEMIIHGLIELKYAVCTTKNQDRHIPSREISLYYQVIR
jgi:hypothetical protein